MTNVPRFLEAPSTTRMKSKDSTSGSRSGRVVSYRLPGLDLIIAHASWEQYRSQPVSVVPEPYQRLNGKFSFEGIPSAADDIRELLERTAGLYSEGDFEIVARIDRIEVTLRDVNASVLPLVYALQVLAKPGSLEGEIDLSSFRAGDLDDYCRFAFRGGEAWLVRPSLWGGGCRNPAPAAATPGTRRVRSRKWKLENGNWKIETRNSKIEIRNSKLENGRVRF